MEFAVKLLSVPQPHLTHGCPQPAGIVTEDSCV
jgi:hypothetical protein